VNVKVKGLPANKATKITVAPMKRRAQLVNDFAKTRYSGNGKSAFGKANSQDILT
jgi:hypothetical protein